MYLVYNNYTFLGYSLISRGTFGRMDGMRTLVVGPMQGSLRWENGGDVVIVDSFPLSVIFFFKRGKKIAVVTFCVNIWFCLGAYPNVLRYQYLFKYFNSSWTVVKYCPPIGVAMAGPDKQTDRLIGHKLCKERTNSDCLWGGRGQMIYRTRLKSFPTIIERLPISC